MITYTATRNCAYRGKTWHGKATYTEADVPSKDTEITPALAADAAGAGILVAVEARPAKKGQAKTDGGGDGE